MKLKEVIRIDEKFQHSINLKLDQMRKEPIENYIPTQASMKILCEYLGELTGKKKEASTMLIGPYGKGKSHLLLVLMYLLNPFDEKLSAHLVEHFRQAEEKTGKNIQEYMERGRNICQWLCLLAASPWNSPIEGTARCFKAIWAGRLHSGQLLYGSGSHDTDMEKRVSGNV